jgi:hypothetical protein
VLENGSRFAGYEIEAVLGHGGMGVVYEARQLALDRMVALKILSGTLGLDPSFQERFRNEVRIQAAIDHPHLVSLYEAGKWEDSLFIAMRLVRGPDLKEMIIARELERARTLRILRPIAEALDAAHEAGLIHRDIKPQNILVGRHDHAYLADFGLTKGTDDAGLTQTGQFFGTIDYIAPEQIRGEPATSACDIYALSAVLYECLTGTVTYPKPSDAAVMDAHLSEPPPRVTDQRPELPPQLDKVIFKGMAKNPSDRYSTAAALIEAAEDALGTRMGAVIRAPGSVASELVLGRSYDPIEEPTIRERLRRAALAGVVPDWAVVGSAMPSARADPDLLERPARRSPSAPNPPSAPDWPEPAAPARVESPAPRSGDDFTKSPSRRSSRAMWGLLFGAAAGALGYLILERLLGSTLPSFDRDPGPEEDVQCTVFAPPSANPGAAILVQAFVHLPEHAADAVAIAREMDTEAARRAYSSLLAPVRHGSRLDLELRVPGHNVEDPVASLVWRGRPEAVQFAVHVPRETRGAVIATLDISRDAVPFGHIKFKLTISDSPSRSRPEPQGERAHRYRAAFISYAANDRDKVLARVQMLSLVGIRWFQDVLELEPGERWSERLEQAIKECDLFLVFWSSEAKRSKWMRREVQFALAQRGSDELARPEIKPVILEGPPVVKPWRELAHLHFNDRMLYFMRTGE